MSGPARAGAAGLLVALLAAAVPTAMDCWENPGGVFRGPDGVAWEPLLATLWSWFWPLALVTVPALLALHAWRRRRR